MSTKFLMTRDINGYNGFGLFPADDKKRMVLATGVEQNFVVPSTYDKWIVIFAYQPGSSVWIGFNTTATLPGGAVEDTDCELNPSGRQLKAGDTVSLITGDSGGDQVGALLYAL